MDFIIDTIGNPNIEAEYIPYKQEETKTGDNSVVKKLLEEYKKSLEEKPLQTEKPKNKSQKLADNIIWNKTSKKNQKRKESELNKHDIEAVLAKSVITPDFEQLHSVPPYDVSEKKLKQQRKREREKTKGKNWFGLPATEVNDDIKNDLEVLKMRSVLDPKHFYKKNDLKVLPKYFQIGKVMDTPLDYYNNRLTRKERKKTLVEELLADAQFNKYNKRKYAEIIAEKQKTHYKAYKQAKKLKRKNKK